MKTKTKVLIAVGSSLLFLIILLILVLILKWNTWVFFGVLIAFAVGWIVTGIILIIKYLNDKKPKLEQIELEEALAMAKSYSINHVDNPDNFIYKDHWIRKVGEQGTEKTAMLTIRGKGTELLEDRYFVINKKNKEEFSLLINPSKEIIEQKIIELSDSQPTPVITEQVADVDAFGRPTTKFVTKTTSRAEIKKQEEEKKAEEESAL